MFKRLLVPLDGSRFSSRVLRYAIEIARRFGAEIILLQVIQPARPFVPTAGIVPDMVSPTTIRITAQAAFMEDKSNATRARRYLSSKVRGIQSQDIKASYQVVVGEPAQSILELSKKERVDMVIMTTHGRTGLKRAVMGSISDIVIRGSGKPVLVIRPKTGWKKVPRKE